MFCHAAHARLVQLLELASVDVVGHDSHAAQPRRIRGERVEQRLVVAAIDRGLDEHAALDA